MQNYIQNRIVIDYRLL